MRWLFLLLLVLNVFYYIWHQQEAPLRAKDVTPLSLYRGGQQDIRLLSETPDSTKEKGKAAQVDPGCLYLGGFTRQDVAQGLERRLSGMEVKYQSLPKGSAESAGYWVRVAPESRRWLDDLQLLNLSREFNELKHKIMPCEGVAPIE
ncbi:MULTISPECIES: hypothetical protein [Pseudomonas]|uniref:hypothetical protein n=1 Tax=Pseudomonas TaxID=286 RepID=UPI0018DCD3F7|nr:MULTISPECIES: hypothetical protein [Pseudomonas]MBH8613506.1 hypothetical protein [Pseudomonas mohnii]